MIRTVRCENLLENTPAYLLGCLELNEMEMIRLGTLTNPSLVKEVIIYQELTDALLTCVPRLLPPSWELFASNANNGASEGLV